jgi:hypothetical protein
LRFLSREKGYRLDQEDGKETKENESEEGGRE